MTLHSRRRTTYSEMSPAQFLAEKGGSEGAYGAASYHSISWQLVQPVAWEERADRNEPTVITKRVSKFIVMRTEVDFVDDGEKDDE